MEDEFAVALSTAQKVGFGVILGALGTIVVSSIYSNYLIRRWLREDIDRYNRQKGLADESLS